MRRIERFGTEHYELVYDFVVNPESCGNPAHYQEYLLYNAISDYRTGMGVSYVMIDTENGTDKIVGFVTLKATSLILKGEDGTLNGMPAIEVSELAVKDGYERQGVGRYLIDYVMCEEEKVRKRIGVQYMLVCSEPKSVGFYEKMHFAKADEYYKVPREEWNATCVPMYMKLPERDCE